MFCKFSAYESWDLFFTFLFGLINLGLTLFIYKATRAATKAAEASVAATEASNEIAKASLELAKVNNEVTEQLRLIEQRRDDAENPQIHITFGRLEDDHNVVVVHFLNLGKRSLILHKLIVKAIGDHDKVMGFRNICDEKTQEDSLENHQRILNVTFPVDQAQSYRFRQSERRDQFDIYFQLFDGPPFGVRFDNCRTNGYVVYAVAPNKLEVKGPVGVEQPHAWSGGYLRK